MSTPFIKAGRLSVTELKRPLVSVQGYEMRFINEDDRKAFAPFRFYLLRPERGVIPKWCLAECETGAVFSSSQTMRGALKFLDQVHEIWPIYRLRYAFVLHDRVQKFAENISEHVRNTYRSEDFDALLVLAKMEGVTMTTKYRQLKPLFEQKEHLCN